MNSLCRNTLLLILLVFSFAVMDMAASPARPVFHTVTLPDGRTVTYRLTGDEHDARAVDSLGNEILIEGFGFPRHPRHSQARLSRGATAMQTSDFPTSGSPRVLVVLAEYSDVKFSTPDPTAYFDSMLNLEGFDGHGATGSARDYFKACSEGRFSPQFDVCGPVTLPKTQRHYGGNSPMADANAHEMVIHACDTLAAHGFDFTPYDNDSDGAIDNVYVIYAGFGESSGNLADINTVWPHSWDIREADTTERKYGNLILGRYSCSNELFSQGIPDGIGTFCHEFSHVLGLPDLYSTGSGTNYTATPGSWSCLDTGCYLNRSRTPPLYSAFERQSLGWLEPTPILTEDDYTLPPLSATGSAYLIRTERDEEFFILENRRREGWDSYLAGEGMLVWHIDYDPAIWMNNAVNSSPGHQRVDLVEAVRRSSSKALPSDPFPGQGQIESFTAEPTGVTPAFLSWSGKDPGYPLTEIKDDGRDIRFHAGGTASAITEIITGTEMPDITGGEAIIISGTDSPVEIYSVTGQRVYAGTARRIELPTGIYIVKAGKRTVKIAVTRP